MRPSPPAAATRARGPGAARGIARCIVSWSVLVAHLPVAPAAHARTDGAGGPESVEAGRRAIARPATSAPSADVAPTSVLLLVRSSPIAGFQFHAGERVWRDLRVGEPLALVREPANPHDTNAVRVDWRGLALGYVPRRDNRQVARQLDLGMALQARVSRLRESRNPWDRVEFEVVLPVASTTPDQSPASSP